MPPIVYSILMQYGNNPFAALWFILSYGGGLIFIPLMVRLSWKGWIFWVNEKFKHHIPHTMLRIEVPQLNEQSMKAVEQIFVHLYGSKDNPSREEKYWDGFVQEAFSFEIASDGGYIAFYIWTPSYYQQMVEAAFYAQYPDAIITVTEDYSREINVDMIMKEEVKVWGAELALEKDDAYPIKSYPHWEDTLVGKPVDPLASILEVMSRLQAGEKWWLQIMATPADPSHIKHKGEAAIAAVVEPGAHAHHDSGFFGKILDLPYTILDAILSVVHQIIMPGEYASESHEADASERQRLTSPERELVEEVDRKMSRWPYEVKIRWMYFAPPNLFDYKKGRRGMLGALAQYKFINSFKEGARTRVYEGTLFWKKLFPKPRVLARARRMLWAYQSRDMERGEHEGFILSTEELASIYHFPMIDVRAPFVAKSTTRGVEPPSQLRYSSDSGEPNLPTVNIESGDLDQAQPGLLTPHQFVNQSAQPGEPVELDTDVATQAPVAESQPTVTLEADTETVITKPVFTIPNVGSDQTGPPSNLPFV